MTKVDMKTEDSGDGIPLKKGWPAPAPAGQHQIWAGCMLSPFTAARNILSGRGLGSVGNRE